ncbi:hypothetical protein PAXRUDRAFT_155641 [Paxillus rubicundulus Ve08.2h10]|uniref:Uncharacterized protein n=1 Tax=Paxillus rubicundulus Ve08.2h10 TaxID=930991 RepID=A0A0D0DQI1_9AGAM|nr:hypothetical protein PAXRUDRAFT_155641 [Paxillus rubicundulus Ve08.2h10]
MAQLKHLTGESALGFLLTHDPEHAEHFGLHIPLASNQDGAYAVLAADAVVTDRPASVTVKTTSRTPLAQDIRVEVPTLNLVFTHSGRFPWPAEIPYPVADCQDVRGTIYLRGQNPPLGASGFNAQQFPSYTSNQGTSGGRIVIEFWNNQRITGVVSDAENYVSGGSGNWSQGT